MSSPLVRASINPWRWRCTGFWENVCTRAYAEYTRLVWITVP